MLRKRLVLKLITLVLVTTIAGLGIPSQADEGARPAIGSEVSGEQLYRGIFFGTGPAAKHLPELSEVLQAAWSQLSPGERRGLDRVFDHIVGFISRKDAAFFEHFGRSVTSGNHFAVEAAVRKGARYLVQGSADYLGRPVRELVQMAAAPEAGDGQWVITALAGFRVLGVVWAGVIFTQVGIVSHVLALDVLVDPGGMAVPTWTLKDSLSRDRLIELITTRFAT